MLHPRALLPQKNVPFEPKKALNYLVRPLVFANKLLLSRDLRSTCFARQSSMHASNVRVINSKTVCAACDVDIFISINFMPEILE